MTEIEIKTLLVKYLLMTHKEFTLGAEVPFQFGERRADLAVFDAPYLYAFEIKSARDSTARLGYQIDSYKKYFDYCYIVCEESNLSDIRRVTPESVGIMVIKNNGIIKVRKSRLFKKLDKTSLLSTLPVTKLREISKNRSIRSKAELCNYIARNKKLADIRKESRNDFINRYSVVSRLLRQETTASLNSDDIYTITKRAPSEIIKRAL